MEKPLPITVKLFQNIYPYALTYLNRIYYCSDWKGSYLNISNDVIPIEPSYQKV